MKNLILILILVSTFLFNSAFAADDSGTGDKSNYIRCIDLIKADDSGTGNKADDSGTGNKADDSGTGKQLNNELLSDYESFALYKCMQSAKN